MAPSARSNSWRVGKDQRRTCCTFKVAVYTGVFAFSCFFLAFFELGRNGYLTGSKGIGQQFASMSWLQTPEQEGETVSDQLAIPGRSATTQVDNDDDEITGGVPMDPNSSSKQEEIASKGEREELQINSHSKHDTNTSLGEGSLEKEEQTQREPVGRIQEEKDGDGGSAATIVPRIDNSTNETLELETGDLKHEHEGETVDNIVVEGKGSSY